jgi:hypothetical protein
MGVQRFEAEDLNACAAWSFAVQGFRCFAVQGFRGFRRFRGRRTAVQGFRCFAVQGFRRFRRSGAAVQMFRRYS